MVAEAAEEEKSSTIIQAFLDMLQVSRAMASSSAVKNGGGVMTKVHRAQHHQPHQTIRSNSCDQNNVIINGGRGCLQYVSDDEEGTITLAT